MMTDSQTLLVEYANKGSESAFRELVTRYLALVYSTALRLVGGDAHLAEDVAQMVFADLARKARWLPRDVLLGGWLHRHTCFVAAKTMRTQRRRQAREREAAEMNALQDHSETNLAHLAPDLDEAINQLGAADRTAILLRFFERQDFRAVGQALGSNEDAAQKRVTRALEKLHSLLRRRGVTFSAAALGTALTAQAVSAAPQGLAAVISGTALASAAAGSGIACTILELLAMTKLKLGLIGAIVIAGVAIPIAINHSSVPASAQQQAPGPQTEAAAAPHELADRLEAEAELVSQSVPFAAQTLSRPAPAFDPMQEIRKGQRLSPEQAQVLESLLAQQPGDLSARCQLLGYYWRRQTGSKAARKPRQDHVLWFIEHHPEMNLDPYASLDPLLDGDAYFQAKAVWLQKANENAQNTTILANAAKFCQLHNRPSAEELLKQAQALEPFNPAWYDQLAQLYALDAGSTAPGVENEAGVKALEQMENAQANTRDEQRKFFNLTKLAQMAFDAGEIAKAQAYARALLQQAAQPREGWDYGDAIYRGNFVLGRIALRQGQIEGAKQHLLASARTTGSPVLGSFGPNMTLAKELLEKGEKETVLEFFRLCSSFWKSDQLAAWAQQVDQGWIPDFGPNLRY